MRVGVVTVFLALCIGCPAQIHGVGSLFLWNGSGETIDVEIDGPTPSKVHLRRNVGKLLDEQVAGNYQIAVSKGSGFPEMLGTEIKKNRLTIFNIGGTACFARADISGMYNKKKSPVKLIEIYKSQMIISVIDEIAALPGQPLPQTRKKTPFGTQRVAVVPCELTSDDWLVEDFIQKLR